MKTIIIWIDAFRKDYLTKKNTPFLHSLKKKFSFTLLKPSFGFSEGASFFTGCYPNKNDQFTLYKYNGEKIKGRILLALPKIGNFFYKIYRYLIGCNLPYLIPINYKYTEYFSISQEKYYSYENILPCKTIFDLLRKNNVKFSFFDWPLIVDNEITRTIPFLGFSEKTKSRIFINSCKKANASVYFFHLTDLDKFGHKYGPNSKETNKKLQDEDNIINEVLTHFDLDNDNVFIWSDHGMLEVKKTIDLQSKLPNFGQGYFYFLDSTMARFWFFNKTKREKVIKILKNIKDGHVLSKKEKIIYKINFHHNKYEEEIFLVNPGILISPNFFHKNPSKGMHGYNLTDKNEYGILLINKKIKKQKAEIVDLFPTILQSIGISHKNEIDGKSLLSS